jgi:hypothetical protein
MNPVVTEHLARSTSWVIAGIDGAAGGDRTHDPWLRRPILYPLSYSRTGEIGSDAKDTVFSPSRPWKLSLAQRFAFHSPGFASIIARSATFAKLHA